MGQWWRLATASVLHANAMHLMVNCYSLKFTSPLWRLSDARRFLTIYFTSAIASSVMSCCMSKAPAVLCFRSNFRTCGWVPQPFSSCGTGQLLEVIGLLSPYIDNWGHLGGLLGGAITLWFIGPARKYESKSINGRT